MSTLLSWHGMVQNHCTFKALAPAYAKGRMRRSRGGSRTSSASARSAQQSTGLEGGQDKPQASSPCCIESHMQQLSHALAWSMQEELRVLQENGFEEDSYAYVACMAVDRDSRRTGAATALLGAAERMAGKWQQNFVLLHTYADNFPGLRLYHRNGCALEHTTLAFSAQDIEACSSLPAASWADAAGTVASCASHMQDLTLQQLDEVFGCTCCSSHAMPRLHDHMPGAAMHL